MLNIMGRQYTSQVWITWLACDLKYVSCHAHELFMTRSYRSGHCVYLPRAISVDSITGQWPALGHAQFHHQQTGQSSNFPIFALLHNATARSINTTSTHLPSTCRFLWHVRYWPLSPTHWVPSASTPEAFRNSLRPILSIISLGCWLTRSTSLPWGRRKELTMQVACWYPGLVS